jgi:hypothetical protein
MLRGAPATMTPSGRPKLALLLYVGPLLIVVGCLSGLTSSGADALRAEASRMAEAARLVTNRGHRVKAGGSSRKASPA